MIHIFDFNDFWWLLRCEFIYIHILWKIYNYSWRAFRIIHHHLISIMFPKTEFKVVDRRTGTDIEVKLFSFVRKHLFTLDWHNPNCIKFLKPDSIRFTRVYTWMLKYIHSRCLRWSDDNVHLTIISKLKALTLKVMSAFFQFSVNLFSLSLGTGYCRRWGECGLCLLYSDSAAGTLTL